ncbi:MAG: ornithine carbamoyltransferase [Anaerolineales bacterium]|nr:ornithine carbamoyltransferase [Anaerolineales bacterium]MCB9126986.1 ornithine carbamoyltransferase [Ardenticatenales bacterium]
MQHFISIADLSAEQWDDLLTLALDLKQELQENGRNAPLLEGKILGMIFQKPSLRTRVSFEVGMLQLGGHAMYISPNEIKMGQRESVADVARVMSRYVSALMARVFDHAHITGLAEYASVPIINGLSDYNHPCQGMADYLTMLENWGSFDGRTLAYIGDGNNVLTSLLNGAIHSGVAVRVATPPGYEPEAAVIDAARQRGVDVALFTDPYEAVSGADAIYTDVWTSMGQEEETAKRLAVFPPFQVNEALVGAANDGAIVLHCLPAHRGEEITDGVADGSHSRLWDQAENRLHAQKAILVRLMAQ